ncbi:unnamed protein product [Clavelina lepadiformis]|uniref:Uncharacterized protein n=1 Tax=Clavelina lepadiformis TaxID=159417 RepID=A0ABP0FBI0_CLALP
MILCQIVIILVSSSFLSHISGVQFTLTEGDNDTWVEICPCGSCNGWFDDCLISSFSFTSCQNFSSSEILENTNSTLEVSFSSWMFNEYHICCNSLISDNSKSLLYSLINNSFIQNLYFHKCQVLVEPDSYNFLVIQGLNFLSVTSETTTEDQTNTLDFDSTDNTTLTENHRTQNIAYLATNIFTSARLIKAFSFPAKIDGSDAPGIYMLQIFADNPVWIFAPVLDTVMITCIYT